MCKFFFPVFLFCFGLCLSQTNIDSLQMENPLHIITIEDSISGGSMAISFNKEIEKLLDSKKTEGCKPTTVYVPRRTPKEGRNAADYCVRHNKVMGYKIQIFYTKDRNAANKVKDEFASKFPGITPEMVYASPDYRILVGDYFTRKSAAPDLRQIRRSFPSAFAVQWRVWCRKAK